MKIALGVEYIGSNYCGWQYQPHCIAVQQYVQEALSSISNERIEVACSGRTDTGVHAIGQVVSFETSAERPMRAWVQGGNTKLPSDIRIAWSKAMPDDFHARFSAVARQYRYVIFNRSVHSAVLAKRVTWQPHGLDHESMHLASQALVGEQDFSAFRAAGCQAEHACREVQQVSVSRQGDFVFVDIQANAFLHHMVRNIVGSLMEIGLGRHSEDWIAELLVNKDRNMAGMTAPAEGLYFVNAVYPEEWQVPQTKLDEVLWQF